jgi:hypothetical protein
MCGAYGSLESRAAASASGGASRTKEGEFRFREALPDSGESTKPRAIFTFMQAIYPDLPATESADSK